MIGKGYLCDQCGKTVVSTVAFFTPALPAGWLQITRPGLVASFTQVCSLECAAAWVASKITLRQSEPT